MLTFGKNIFVVTR